MTFEFTMEMTCEGCAAAAKKVLEKLGDKVSNIQTDVTSQKVLVDSTSMTSDELLEQLKKTGKAVSVVEK
ncbi:copper transport protein ATOX1 homolog isoform X2 [Babylonia areolata]|uniref:copper transport protein ATOX1 homolog isoform X2 n=1 Tax=Babylonia areolata TaxID=304850 RepID=UPI003FD1F68A